MALCQSLVCISKRVPIRVISYPHLFRRHFGALLTPASLFVLQFSLIFSVCGRQVQFCVVTHMHIFVITLGLKVICTNFHIDARARQHVDNPICTRTALCPFLFVSPFTRDGACSILHFREILNVYICNYIFFMQLHRTVDNCYGFLLFTQRNTRHPLACVGMNSRHHIYGTRKYSHHKIEISEATALFMNACLQRLFKCDLIMAFDHSYLSS